MFFFVRISFFVLYILCFDDKHIIVHSLKKFFAIFLWMFLQAKPSGYVFQSKLEKLEMYALFVEWLDNTVISEINARD